MNLPQKKAWIQKAGNEELEQSLTVINDGQQVDHRQSTIQSTITKKRLKNQDKTSCKCTIF
ncbi:hypothetical protein pb186bvf_003813 [Paramecium bursaria]